MKTQARTNPEAFRDHISTVDPSGRRLWVFPSKPEGKLFRARAIVATVLLAFFFVSPFLKVNGEPLLLLDIADRYFILFGGVFRPHDLHLLVLAILTAAIFVVLFTAVLGRLFCGWICPQTVFMEMVFRRIEYWIDGSPARQRKLREGRWTAVKTGKRLLKHSIFLGLSFVIGNFMLAYFIGIDELGRIVTDPPAEHLSGLTAMLFFTLAFYFVFAWFREQACTLVCPYGRLQGVLIDASSVVVAYDHVRGEPRARLSRDDSRTSQGDCIDCGACVRVCPTGIDIRNGTQLECINCTACIDACNDMMRRVRFPEGLVRYTSENRIVGRKRARLTGRVVLYAVAFAALAASLSFFLATRSEVEATILRTPGTLYYETDAGTIRNLYSVKLINKTFEPMSIELRLKAPVGGTISMVQGDIRLEPEGVGDAAFFVELPIDALSGRATIVTVEIVREGEVQEEIATSFEGPDGRSR